jgi:hypothetical protein
LSLIDDLEQLLFGYSGFKTTQDYGCTGSDLESFNPRHPECQHFHEGIDFPAATGTPVLSPSNGTVTEVGSPESSYGNQYVKLRSGSQDLIFGHFEQANVQVGQQVTKGQVIGYVGSRGLSTGPHLHFEVRPAGGGYGTSVDPSKVTLGVTSLANTGGGIFDIPGAIHEFTTSFEKTILTGGFLMIGLILVIAGLAAIVLSGLQTGANARQAITTGAGNARYVGSGTRAPVTGGTPAAV